MVVHLLEARGSDSEAALVGVVVSKAIGNAVDRNLVKRRLRGLLRGRLEELAPGERMVGRALPAARGASSADLARDLETAFAGARRRVGASQ